MFPKSTKTQRSPTRQTPPLPHKSTEVRHTEQENLPDQPDRVFTKPPATPVKTPVINPTQFIPPPIPAYNPKQLKTKTSERRDKKPVKEVIPLQEKIEETMNQQQIQQTISSSVPEFSGENQSDLIRFMATADSIYQMLGSDAEKKIFDRLIKLRLTGEAFTRITHRNVEDYPTLRELLNNMYSKTYTLEELERGYTTVQQSYGETIRNYGYRLLEALEQYKMGYKAKYKIDRIDNAYKNHIEINSVQIFKRGLNNTILREKMATSTAKNIDEIINETEIVEKMLTLTTNTPTAYNPAQNLTSNSIPNHTKQQKINYHQITCNYCQQPNHTWDVCRTRINHERTRRMTTQLYGTQRQQTPIRYHNSARPEIYNRQYPAPIHQNQQHNRAPVNMQQSRNQFPPAQRYPPKYCSYCKTTTGHTFDECRSKFFPKISYQLNNKQNPSTDTRELTDRLGNMRINMIHPQYPAPPDQYTHQGNANRSDQ